MSILRRLLCDHDWRWERNVYGDEINMAGGMRSIWHCPKCDGHQMRGELYKGPRSEYDENLREAER